MVDPMELERQVGELGYSIRVLEQLQIAVGGGEVQMFCIESGGPHPNPAVSGCADFGYFDLSSGGLEKAQAWVDVRKL
jgi:hypothetical protein